MRHNLATRRKRLDLTREDIASISGVSFSTVVRAENGKRISPLAERAIEAALAIKEAERKAVTR